MVMIIFSKSHDIGNIQCVIDLNENNKWRTCVKTFVKINDTQVNTPHKTPKNSFTQLQ